MSYSSPPGAGGTYDVFNSAASGAMSGVHTRQQGFDFFGHARIAKSPVSVFGLFQYFQPNTNFDASTIGLEVPYSARPQPWTRSKVGIQVKTKEGELGAQCRRILPEKMGSQGSVFILCDKSVTLA